MRHLRRKNVIGQNQKEPEPKLHTPLLYRMVELLIFPLCFVCRLYIAKKTKKKLDSSICRRLILTTIYTHPQNQSQLTNQRTQYIQLTFNTINQINNVQFILTLPPTMTCRTGTTTHKTATANTLLFPPPSPFPSQKMRVRVTRRKTFYFRLFVSA